eukprot:1078292_1
MAATGWLFALPPRITQWIRSQKAYNIIFSRPQHVARSLFLHAKHNPAVFGAQAVGAGVAYVVYKKATAVHGDSLGKESIFIHPEVRNDRDTFGNSSMISHIGSVRLMANHNKS